MRQKRASIDEATHAYKNSDDSEQISQCRFSRYEETRASENAAHAEHMSQHRL